jgi:hypothetical protein
MTMPAAWLTQDRARAYGTVFSLAMLILLTGAYVQILKPAWQDPHFRPLASDFDPFWSAARMALRGAGALVYDGAAIHAEENTGAQLPPGEVMLYQYPPTFLMLCLPLALLPYIPALLIFLGTGYAATVVCLKRILPPRWPVLPVLAFPGAVMNWIIGQNGFVSASCFGGAALLLERRPALAGALLGVFACKPHLAVCLPVALGAARRWTAFCACGAMAACITLLSWAVLGNGPWLGFFHTLWVSRAVLQSEQTGPKVITVYEAVRLLHGGVGLAASAQALAALASLGLVACICARRPGGVPEIAAAIAGGLLCTPYAMDYDLVCLGVPLAYVAREGSGSHWRAPEKLILILCYGLPLCVRTVNLRGGVPLAPPLIACLFGVLALRAMRSHRPALALA